MKNIAVITGGYSGEDVISRQSAAWVMENIDASLFNAYLIDISKLGWYWNDGEENISIDKNDFSLLVGSKRVQFDAAFLALHGTPGEDGVLQGYFDMLGIPYTTGSPFSMAITFNKYAAVQLLRSAGIAVENSFLVRKGQTWNKEKIERELGFPCFVKPNFGGSSIGISKVNAINELDDAIKKALNESEEVIIEGFMSGREFTCGVVQYKEEVRAIAVTEIVSKNEFFDYESKYDTSLVDEITPAPIPDNLYKECQDLAEETFKVMGCKGIGRVDFILTESGFKVIEINTVPGMTEVSLIPQMAEVSGIPKKELITTLLNNVL